MSHFENTNEAYPNLGGRKSAEQLADERAAREKAEADKIEFISQRQREMKSETDAADKESRERAAEILEKQAIEICMEANPNLSWREAKSLYDHELKQIIAIRRFEIAFFGSPDKTRAIFSGVKM